VNFDLEDDPLSLFKPQVDLCLPLIARWTFDLPYISSYKGQMEGVGFVVFCSVDGKG